MTIRELLDNSIDHERIPTDVDRRLTIAAWAGIGLLLVQLLILDIGRGATEGFPTWGIVSWAFTGFGNPDTAFALTLVAVAAGLAGALATRGFTRATAVGHGGQLGLMAGGIAAAIPTAWIVLVGAIVIAAIAAACLVLGYLLVAMLLDL